MIGDIDPNHPGMEVYAGEAKGGFEYFLYSAGGERLSDKKEVMQGDLAPYAVWWDSDELKEIVSKDSFSNTRCLDCHQETSRRIRKISVYVMSKNVHHLQN